jgi:hypothetical protein
MVVPATRPPQARSGYGKVAGHPGNDAQSLQCIQVDCAEVAQGFRVVPARIA